MNTVDDNVIRTSRLSGECPRSAHYVRQHQGIQYPGERVYPRKPKPKPKKPVWKPKKYGPPTPRVPRGLPKPIPFKPLARRGIPFGNFRPIMPTGGALGGLTARGGRMLIRALRPWPLALGFLLLDFVPWGPRPNGGFNPGAGWTKKCDIGGAKPVIKFATNDPNLACPTAGQVPGVASNEGTDFPVPAPLQGSRWIGLGFPTSGGIRFTITEQWVRPTGTPPQITVPYVPGHYPAAPPRLPAVPVPAVDPFPLPILQPVPNPRPIPYRVIPHRRPNPNRSPDEQPGSSQPSRPPYKPPNHTGPGEIVVTPNPKPGRPPKATQPKPGWHVPRKPIRREKEKKLITSIRSQSIAGILIGILTESLDVLNAFHKALPRKYQALGGNPYEKLQAVLAHFDKINRGQIVTNLVSEILEDEGYGRLGKLVAKANRELGIHFERGPHDDMVSKHMNEVGKQLPDGFDLTEYVDDFIGELLGV